MERRPVGTIGPDIRSLRVFDFDGTLSPIVDDRHAARVHPMCRELLKGLARMPWHFVAVLSSREIEDVTGAADIMFLHVATRFLFGAFLILLGALGLTRSGCLDSTVFSRVRKLRGPPVQAV
ncbi:MAG: hypothetical protein NUW14_09085 [Deltaproteobacteria bacterium]|uniref:trehalose-phosphatase n=1 Tax=Candidatus Deferrimicrobium sp. TaxID=3060586 RepID=UPI002724E76D|nr:trehalose-phosphatase [Candidatus Deferrimicrobium sp.]MCR4310146.1 hypothetical protein [Deltaproteobacteria bacterium]MDO8738660.1 trehalose-phosphatase [Candidatus Deferrimicrobium sp.]